MERMCSWTGSLNIIKMSSSPELIYKYNPVANKITAGSSVKIVNCQAESEIQQKQAKDLKWNFIKKDVLLINKQKIPKSFLSLKLDIREVKCKFKLQWLNISHPLSSLRFWKLTTSNVGKDACGWSNWNSHCFRECNLVHSEEQPAAPLLAIFPRHMPPKRLAHKYSQLLYL